MGLIVFIHTTNWIKYGNLYNSMESISLNANLDKFMKIETLLSEKS
jgi:hypothetical protein